MISCAIGGSLRRYMTPENLERLLQEELMEEEVPARRNLGGLLQRIRKGKAGKEEDGHAEE